jgi:hypothetical protein
MNYPFCANPGCDLWRHRLGRVPLQAGNSYQHHIAKFVSISIRGLQRPGAKAGWTKFKKRNSATQTENIALRV